MSASPTLQFIGVGLAFADLDNDGDSDLVILGRTDGRIGVFENDGTGNFTDRSTTSGLPLRPEASSVTAADYDADGDLDLHIGVWTRPSPGDQPDVLARNNGNWTFTDVAAAAGVGDIGATGGCTWGDYDGDGWLDVYAPIRYGTDGDFTSENHLYRNQGNGTFVDMSNALGVDDPGAPTLLAQFFDYDRDGDPDFYLGCDHGSGGTISNRFFENTGSAFIEITTQTGTAGYIDCMGIALGDLMHSRRQDMYLTNLPIGNKLYSNNGDGTYTDNSVASGLVSYAYGWGTVFFDYDNNTWLDTYITTFNALNQLFKGTGTWPYSNVAGAMGVADAADSYAVAVADIDNDGDLDMAVLSYNVNTRLYINHEGTNRRWIKFDVVGQGANLRAIGANVDVRTGSVWQMREVYNGGNYKSQNEIRLHFGMNTALMADEIQVTWPWATATRTLYNYATNQTWTLYPPERLGDADDDGDVDRSDIRAAQACYTEPGPGNLTPGCELFDMDGDGDVDNDDLAAMGLQTLPPGPPIQGTSGPVILHP